MDLENMLNALKTVKEECEQENCGDCPIRSFCDDIFSESPGHWEIPGILPKSITLTGKNLQQVYRALSSTGCGVCPCRDCCQGGMSCEENIRMWLNSI